LFFLLILIVPACYKRWYSVLAGVVFILIFIFFLYARTVMTKQLLNWIIDLSCIMSGVNFLVAIIQKIVIRKDGYRPDACFFNPNYYGMIIEFVIIMCVFKILTSKKKQWFYISTIAVNAVALLVCDSQSAIPAVICAIMLMLLLTKHYKIAITFVALAVGGILLIILLPLNIFPRFGIVDVSSTVRMEIWTAAIHGIMKHPIFGQGVLTYAFIYEPYNGYPTTHAHSIFLDPILSFGIVGTVLLVIFLVPIYKKVIKDYVFSRNGKVPLLIIALTIAVFVHGATDLTILWLQTAMLFLIPLACSNIDENKLQEVSL
ncbi:MAG: O-antigen ligase family protein, partial [Oscillospiraceae bacterium]